MPQMSNRKRMIYQVGRAKEAALKALWHLDTLRTVADCKNDVVNKALPTAQQLGETWLDLLERIKAEL